MEQVMCPKCGSSKTKLAEIKGKYVSVCSTCGTAEGKKNKFESISFASKGKENLMDHSIVEIMDDHPTAFIGFFVIIGVIVAAIVTREFSNILYAIGTIGVTLIGFDFARRRFF